jgi:FkbM family methyltransferase
VLRYAALRAAHVDAVTTVSVGGVRLRVRVNCGELYSFDEVFLSRTYEQVPGFGPVAGSTVIDVGANVGSFTLRHGLAGANVFAIEPNPDTYGRLRWNLNANGVAANTRCCALGARASRGMFAGHGTRTRVDVGDGDVEIETLDDAAAQLGTIDLLKIDVEGAEVEVLLGAERTLDRVRRVVLEWHEEELLDDVRTILRRHGFGEVGLRVRGAWFARS